MENYSSFNDEKSSFDNFELQLTEQAKDFLRETAKWATFITILGFIGLGFMILMGLFVSAMGSQMAEAQAAMGQSSPIPMGALGIFYIVVAVFYFFPLMYLFKFASGIKDALNSNNTERLTIAFGNLKSHYKFIGILMIVFIALFVLMFIFGIAAGLAAFV
ncbi:hypothetical protein GR160_04910 [Flavobacterium sp. Sd200]|uniref:DUF5362 family protein n=1 Tax=Flavobacterium sp. Sd200 TaxID=2692211 RepID=UPI00136FB1AB|nr:DUF5362 family protein [Flavobacterium sp. Sd200]MXN90557.1 hypothetical protein [Flavobacterium sp. Sd200]